MKFNILESAGISARYLEKLGKLLDGIYASAAAECPDDRTTGRDYKAMISRTAGNLIANIGLSPTFSENPYNYMDDFAFPLLEKVSDYMPEMPYKPLMIDMLCYATEAQKNIFLALADNQDINSKRKYDIIHRAFGEADKLFEMMKQNELSHRELYSCYRNMSEYDDSERWAAIGADIKKMKRNIKGWKRSGNWVISTLAKKVGRELKPIELLFEHKNESHIQALMPAFKGLSNNPYNLEALAKVAAASTDCDTEYIKMRAKHAEKVRAKALKGREKQWDVFMGFLDDFEFGNAVLALRNKRYLKLHGAKPLAYTNRIHLPEITQAVRGISNEIFIDDFISPELDEEAPMWKISPQPSIANIVHNKVHPSTLVEGLKDSGLHMSMKTGKKIYAFLSTYLTHEYSDDPEKMGGLAARARAAYRPNGRTPIYRYDIETGELDVEKFPRGKKLLNEANELVGKVLREKLAKKPGKKYHEYKNIKKDDPEQLSRFMFGLSKGCANSIRDSLLMHANLLINQPSFAMVYHTRADPNSIFIKSPEREWRDMFGGWAADSCTDPLAAAEFIANKNVDCKQIWWGGTQYGLAYRVDGHDSSNKKSMSLDSVEVHPAFFSKFGDKFGLDDAETDDKLLGATMKVMEHEADGRAFYLNPTSNQVRITRWLKRYARKHGAQLYRTNVNDNHTDVNYSQLERLYMVNG